MTFLISSLTGPKNCSVVNSSWTKAVITHAKGIAIPVDNNLTHNSTAVEDVSTVKTLGIYYFSTLQWHQHVNFVLQKLCSITGIVIRHRNALATLFYIVMHCSCLVLIMLILCGEGRQKQIWTKYYSRKRGFYDLSPVSLLETTRANISQIQHL